ncbi:MAG: transferase [Crocinitomix sp.]|nr:transferase [Crocinitomix sp.]
MKDIAATAKIGENVIIGKFVIIEDDVEIGDGSFIGDFTLIRSGARIGKNCKIKSYNEIRNNVKIGDNSNFGSRCTLCADTVIGSNVDVKFGFVSTTLDFKKQVDLDAGAVGDGAIVGANVSLMPGASIGKGAMIGACSQLRDVAGENEIWFGNPAKFYKMRDQL